MALTPSAGPEKQHVDINIHGIRLLLVALCPEMNTFEYPSTLVTNLGGYLSPH